MGEVEDGPRRVGGQENSVVAPAAPETASSVALATKFRVRTISSSTFSILRLGGSIPNWLIFKAVIAFPVSESPSNRTSASHVTRRVISRTVISPATLNAVLLPSSHFDGKPLIEAFLQVARGYVADCK